MYLENYIPAIDDLYTYDVSNGGFPTGWNPTHALYPRRSELTWIGVAFRAVTFEAAGYDLFNTYDLNNGGALQPLEQRPNWYNPNRPTLTFIQPTLAIGAMHFWDGLLQERERPAVAGLWSLPQIRFLTAAGDLISRNNADFLGTYNKVSGAFVGMLDSGFCEYVGASPATGASMNVFRANTHPGPYTGWVIERNGRAVPIVITHTSLSMNGIPSPFGPPIFSGQPPSSGGFLMHLDFGRFAFPYPGDSGGIILLELDGVFLYLGHLAFEGLSQPTAANSTRPNAAWFASVGAPFTVVNRTYSNYASATQTTALLMRQTAQGIL